MGMSSTGGENTQLDVGRTYMDKDTSRLEKESILTCGISLSLYEFANWTSELKCAVPHGVCGEVHLGGHVQTGGSGLGTRMFGLFGDHVISFRIITFDGVRHVTRENDPGLFFAVLGGGPGSVGVLTHISVRVNKDRDFHVVEECNSYICIHMHI